MEKEYINREDLKREISYSSSEFKKLYNKENNESKKHFKWCFYFGAILSLIIFFWYNSTVYEEDMISLWVAMGAGFGFAIVSFALFFIGNVGFDSYDRYVFKYQDIFFKYLNKRYLKKVSIFYYDKMLSRFINNKILDPQLIIINKVNSISYVDGDYIIHLLLIKSLDGNGRYSQITNNCICAEIHIPIAQDIKIIKNILDKMNNEHKLQYEYKIDGLSIFLKYDMSKHKNLIHIGKNKKYYGQFGFYNEFEKLIFYGNKIKNSNL